MNWNFKNTTSKKNITGYEDEEGKILSILKEYNSERYKQSNEEEQQRMIDVIFNIYRYKNIFPIRYYNEKGIKEEIQKCIDKEIQWEGNILNFRFNQGQSLCRYFFPNMQKVNVGGRKNNSMWDRFYDDYKLRKAIEFCMKFDKEATPTKLLAGLRMIGGGVSTNFKTMNAKAIFERYCPENGIIYDFASGFGGRLLASLSSKKNFKYIGVEPCLETFEGLNTLGTWIEDVTGREKSFKIYNDVSESFMIKENYVDFAFSSPPYFCLEEYSNEETQCYNKYPNIEDWFENYVKPTIKNIYKMLKPNCYYAVNIADFNLKGKRVELVDKWMKLSEEVGFEFVEKIEMKLQIRRGEGHGTKGNYKDKKEGIYVFLKNNKVKI